MVFHSIMGGYLDEAARRRITMLLDELERRHILLSVLSNKPENEGKVIVTFVCDTGERYISTEMYN